MTKARQLWGRAFAFVIAHRVLFGAILIFAIALALRTVNLESWPRWFCDEGNYGLAGTSFLSGHFGSWYKDSGMNAPLFPWVCGLMTNTLGQSYLAIRLPGAVLGALSCVLLYLIASRLYNRRVGIAASLMLAVATTYLNRVALMWNLAEFFFLAAFFCYLKVRDDGRRYWAYLLGASMGFGILSSLYFVVVAIFVGIQSLLDRKFSKIWTSWVILAALGGLPYLLIAMHIGWNYFIYDLFLPDRKASADMVGLLQLLLMTRPESQLAWNETIRFNIWSTLGFISSFCLLGRNKPGDRHLLTALACLVLGAVITGSIFWWGHLALFYPLFCTSIAVLLYDILSGKSNSWLLGLFSLLLLLPLFTYGYLRPTPPAEFSRYFFLLAFAVFLLTVAVNSFLSRRKRQSSESNGSQSSRFFSIFVSMLLVIIMLGNTAYDLRNIRSDEAADQKATVDFINAHTKEGDLVAAADPIVYLLKDRVGIRYTDVAFYTTRIEFRNYRVRYSIPRYKMDVSLDKMSYFVLDSPFNGLREWAAALRPLIESTWKPVASFGDYKIYENPGKTLAKMALIDDDQYAPGLWEKSTVPGDTVTFTNDSTVKSSGNNSLRIEFNLTGNNAIYYSKVPQDWSSFKAISFQWYGCQAGAIALDILAPDWNNYFHIAFTDNWIGWRQLFFALDGAGKIGKPSWDKVTKIAFKFYSLPTSGTVYLDEVNLHKLKEDNGETPR